MLVDFAFNTLGLDEVFCNVTVGNEPSRRSVEGSGFTFKEEKDGQWVYVLANPARQEVIE
jgi:RimJ/RimL family protein N-acetyltransferase